MMINIGLINRGNYKLSGDKNIGIFFVNKQSNDFYKKWIRDTRVSLFVAAPIFLFFSFLCFTLIVGFSPKLFLIMMLPIAWGFFALINRPLFIRRKYFNRLIKKIEIDDEYITLSTYKWFSFNPILVKLKLKEIKIRKINDEPFFKDNTVYLLTSPKLKDVCLYLLMDFFDDDISVCKLFNINVGESAPPPGARIGIGQKR